MDSLERYDSSLDASRDVRGLDDFSQVEIERYANLRQRGAPNDQGDKRYVAPTMMVMIFFCR